MDLGSQFSGSQFSGTNTLGIMPGVVSSAPNTLAVDLLTTLEKEIGNLPVLPNASESDEIAAFSGNIPTDLTKEDAWEHLDQMLNRFVGFNRMLESICSKLQGGAKGLSVMVRYLKDFVGQYQIDGALLEGKIQRLVNVIQKQYVDLTRSEYTHF